MTKNDKIRITSGMNLRDAERVALTLGCQIESVRGTGECRATHHLLPTESVRYTIVGRRKDAPRALTVFLRRVSEAVEAAKG